MMMMMVNFINDWFWWFSPVHCLSLVHCFPRLKSERFLVGSHEASRRLSEREKPREEEKPLIFDFIALDIDDVCAFSL
jgi:hypothetical protein